jgi:alkanesulfonate monooxygenase
MIATRASSETRPAEGPLIDMPFTRAFARVHEESGFDRVLIGYYSDAPDGFVIASDVFAHTGRLGVLLAHRPGFVAPTVTARKLASLDQFSQGRLAVHVISGGSDADQRRDGDFLDHDARYRRTDEYLDILRAVWTADGPLDHAGEFYRFEGASPAVRPAQLPYLPIYFGGSSDAAIAVATRHADVYALWGEPLDASRAHIERVRAAAAANGRSLRFSVSLRAILGASEEAAWERARSLLAQARAQAAARGFTTTARSESVGSERLLRAAAAGDVTTRASSPRSPRRPVRAATRRRWSGQPNRWRSRCCGTSTSASRPSSCAASTRWRTRAAMRTSSGSCVARWHGARTRIRRTR